MTLDNQPFQSSLDTQQGKVNIISLEKVAATHPQIKKLPFSIRILLENALRNYDNFLVTDEHIEHLINWNPQGSDHPVPYKPARVLMQDFTGVPAVVDIAAIRSEAIRKGKDGAKINPKVPVDLVIDHSVQVDFFGTDYAYKKNVEFEYQRNSERYELLKWAQNAFEDFTVVPPGMGICHQVNLEYLAKGVVQRKGPDGQDWAFPDTLVGTDSHTPMVNGIGVIGWGVGGIEAEAALLGQPIYFSSPKVIGLELTGQLPEGITATDMVLEITQQLRAYGVVGDFVEVFGEGLDHLSVPDRATISNMSPEFGCTVTYFPIDDQTLRYMEKTNRDPQQMALVEQYCKNNLLWRTGKEDIEYSDVLQVDLSSLEPSVSGPKRPQDKILVSNLKDQFGKLLQDVHGRAYVPREERATWYAEGGSGTARNKDLGAQEQEADVMVEDSSLKSVRIRQNNQEYVLSDGSIVVAAITSCTNTSNPSVMLGAGLVARKAVAKGIDVKPWVKTSLAPGSKVVTSYLERAGLLKDLEALKFHVVGYGCTTCIGNSGPLPVHIEEAIDKSELVVASVLSGNRNFEARIHPKIQMNFLASPMLVVAYAIAGRVDINLMEEPLTTDVNGQEVYLKDIWPTQEEIQEAIEASTTKADYAHEYSVIFEGEEQWKNLPAPEGLDYEWRTDSSYIKEIPFFKNISEHPEALKNIENARVLLKLGESITTDHISPAGSFSEDSPAGQYLKAKGIERSMFNSYGSRRGNHEVMMRGTFANVRINNQIAGRQGGYTTYFPENKEMSVYDAAMKYQESNTPLIVIAGAEYGSGSSRDWAAKGTNLLGIRAVIAKSYERIHRSNLVGLGVLPLEFAEGEDANTLGLSGQEVISITGIESGIHAGKKLDVTATKEDGSKIEFQVITRLDSAIEVEYVKHGGILQYVLRQFLEE